MRFSFLLISIWLCTSSYKVQSQSIDSTVLSYRPNALFIEFFSGPVFYSINYQHIAPTQAKWAFSYRLSSSYLPGYQSLGGYIGGIWGRPNKAIEFMLGSGLYRARGDMITFNQPAPLDNYLFLNPQLGFRGDKVISGFLVRLTFTPWMLLNHGYRSIRFTPGIGFSLGKEF